MQDLGRGKPSGDDKGHKHVIDVKLAWTDDERQIAVLVTEMLAAGTLHEYVSRGAVVLRCTHLRDGARMVMVVCACVPLKRPCLTRCTCVVSSPAVHRRTTTQLHASSWHRDAAHTA